MTVRYGLDRLAILHDVNPGSGAKGQSIDAGAINGQANDSGMIIRSRRTAGHDRQLDLGLRSERHIHSLTHPDKRRNRPGVRRNRFAVSPGGKSGRNSFGIARTLCWG